MNSIQRKFVSDLYGISVAPFSPFQQYQIPCEAMAGIGCFTLWLVDGIAKVIRLGLTYQVSTGWSSYICRCSEARQAWSLR